jgi:hypothetical protein
MSLAHADLPADPEALRAFALACQAELKAAEVSVQLRTLEIEKLRLQIAKLRRMQFGRSSERVTRQRAQTVPLIDGFFDWATRTLAKLSAKSALADAFRYALSRREALSHFLTDGRLEADNNIAENAIRGIALGRKNYLFAGSDTGGERAAAIYTIVQTAKLNELNPEAYLRDTLARIAEGHPINRIDELMPWAKSVSEHFREVQ